MANKKILTGMSVLIFVMLCAGNLHAQQLLPLNDAIIQAARSIEEGLGAKTRVAILDFPSDDEKLSENIIDKLSEVLVNDKKVVVIERRRLDLIRPETEKQYSGDVDDDYRVSLGKQWGAQVIVYGYLRKVRGPLSFMIKAVNVETTVVEAQKSYNIDETDTMLPGETIRIPEMVYGPYRDPIESGRSRDPISTPKPKDIGDFQVGGWFSFYNPLGANDGDLRVGIDSFISFTRAFTGSFRLNILLQHYSGINTGGTAEYYTDRGISPVRDFLYLRVTPSLSLPLGPGGLRLSLQLMPVFYLTNNYDFFYEYGGQDIGPTFIFNPIIRYWLDTGIGRLYFEAGTDDMGIAEGADYDKDTGEYTYGLWIRDLYFTVEAKPVDRLSLRVSSYFFMNTNDYQIDRYFRKLRAEMSYAFTRQITCGLRVDFPIGTEANKTTMEYQGITLVPYAQAEFGGLGITAFFHAYRIGASSPGYREVAIMPVIGVFYNIHL
ncbi:MAG: CsgG/HfaB family protein [Spirochaetaceae bacterium]|nr:CsgG/HfaB family protein [Spirochaetaceae bacterium]